MRPKDLNTILFFSGKLAGLRDDHKLIRIDAEKWRKKAATLE